MINQMRITLDSTQRKIIESLRNADPILLELSPPEVAELVLTEGLLDRMRKIHIAGKPLSSGRLVERRSIDFVGREDRYDAVFSRVLKSHGRVA